jgi:predicted RNA methylase
MTMPPEWINLSIYSALIVSVMLFAYWAYYWLRTGAQTFPSTPAARDRITAVIKEDMARAPKDKPYIIYDLGSGSGQLSWHIANNLPQAQVIGIELSWIPYFRAVILQKMTRKKNLKFTRVNFWTHDISNASVVVTYLTEALMPRVGEKLRSELPQDALVICNKYGIPHWTPHDIVKVQSPISKRLLIYRQASDLDDVNEFPIYESLDSRQVA